MSPTSRKRPSRKRKVKLRRKRGDDYQLAVAQVAKSIEPAAHVVVGTWVDGPDGRRDLDVAVRSADGKNLLTVIECKDWNKPIGIAFIDALDSKRKDLGAKVAIICSNSGFTADALRKAARVGIPTLAALIKGDSRIRVVVTQQVYTRIIRFERHSPTFNFNQRLSAEQKATLQGALIPRTSPTWIPSSRPVKSWMTMLPSYPDRAGVATLPSKSDHHRPGRRMRELP